METGSTALGKCVGKNIEAVNYDKNVEGDERVILRFGKGEYLELELTNGLLCVSYFDNKASFKIPAKEGE